MRRWALALLLAVATTGCAETVRCPEDQVFDEDGECVPAPDGGLGADAGDDGG
jgi:hypothetical protein